MDYLPSSSCCNWPMRRQVNRIRFKSSPVVFNRPPDAKTSSGNYLLQPTQYAAAAGSQARASAPPLTPRAGLFVALRGSQAPFLGRLPDAADEPRRADRPVARHRWSRVPLRPARHDEHLHPGLQFNSPTTGAVLGGFDISRGIDAPDDLDQYGQRVRRPTTGIPEPGRCARRFHDVSRRTRVRCDADLIAAEVLTVPRARPTLTALQTAPGAVAMPPVMDQFRRDTAVLWGVRGAGSCGIYDSLHHAG